ncbi:hypothetical protein Bpfe_012523 [Biomphalaria pfeifferi]|uniref:Uncharacterized protein n=1 Tax=Biomphalaria pfeifferi TaxID=112525 RepID=A0AAD8BQ88_BIOPF|nr:hypothetical protein Bpfe_012523 [Biomphalaria pfeifferi]
MGQPVPSMGQPVSSMQQHWCLLLHVEWGNLFPACSNIGAYSYTWNLATCTQHAATLVPTPTRGMGQPIPSMQQHWGLLLHVEWGNLFSASSNIGA